MTVMIIVPLRFRRRLAGAQAGPDSRASTLYVLETQPRSGDPPQDPQGHLVDGRARST